MYHLIPRQTLTHWLLGVDYCAQVDEIFCMKSAPRAICVDVRTAQLTTLAIKSPKGLKWKEIALSFISIIFSIQKCCLII